MSCERQPFGKGQDWANQYQVSLWCSKGEANGAERKLSDVLKEEQRSTNGLWLL